MLADADAEDCEVPVSVLLGLGVGGVMDAELEMGVDWICTEVEDLLTPIALADDVGTGEAEINEGCVLVGDASELEMLGEGPLYN